MQKLIIAAGLLLLACGSALPAHATVSWLHTASGTSSPLTVTSTTAGNVVVAMTSSTNTPSAPSLGSQTMTKAFCVAHAFSAGPLEDCTWYVTSATGSQTSVACSSCTGTNFIAEGEASGAVSPFIDYFQACTSDGGQCQTNGAGSVVGITYNPGYTSEAIMFGSSCSGNSGTPTSTNITLTTALPNSNPIGWGVSSGTGLVAMTPTPPCDSADGMAIGVVGNSTQNMTANHAFQCASAETTTGSITQTCQVAHSGDLFLAPAWCLSSCTISTFTLGSQNLTCPGGNATGVSDANTGQPTVCYVVTTASGSLTLTFTPGGSPSEYQVIGFDIPISAQSTIAYDKAAFSNCASSCSEGTTITTPSFTASAGEQLFNFTVNQFHTTGFGGSWGCYVFAETSTSTDTCFTPTTENGLAWITNSGSGSVSADATIISSDAPFQSIIVGFTQTSTVGGGTTIIPALPLLGTGVGDRPEPTPVD